MVDALTEEKPLELRAAAEMGKRIGPEENDGIESHLDSSGVPYPEFFDHAAHAISMTKTSAYLAQKGALDTIVKPETSESKGKDTEPKRKILRSVAHYLQRRVFRSPFRSTSVSPATEDSQDNKTVDNRENKLTESVTDTAQSKTQNVSTESESRKSLKERILNRRPKWLEEATTKLRKGAALLSWRGISADQKTSDLADTRNLIVDGIDEAQARETVESGSDVTQAIKSTADELQNQITGSDASSSTTQEGATETGGSGNSEQQEAHIDVQAPPAVSGDIATLQSEIDKLQNKESSSVDLNHSEHKPDDEKDQSNTTSSGDGTSEATEDDAQPSVLSPESQSTMATPVVSPDNTSGTPPQEIGKPKRGGLFGLLFGGRTDE